MPRRTARPDRIPFVSPRARTVRANPDNSDDELKPTITRDEWGALSITETQESEIVAALRLSSAKQQQAAMGAIYSILDAFDVEQRSALVVPTTREEAVRAQHAITALPAAITALRHLGPRATKVVQGLHHEPDRIEEILCGLIDAHTSLVLFAQTFEVKPGRVGNAVVLDAVRRLAEVYEDYCGKAPGMNGPFQRFCLTALKMVDGRVTSSMIQTLIRTVVAERERP